MESAHPSLNHQYHQFIQRDFAIISPNASLQEAVQVIREVRDQAASRSYTCILVLENQQLVGLLTERDLVKLAAQQRILRQTKVAEVMTTNLITCQEAAAKEPMTVIQLLHQHRIRHLPILNEQNQLVGLVTQSSIRNVLQPADLLKCRYVQEVMTEKVIHATPTSTVLELAKIIADHHVSCVVIGNELQPGKIQPLGIVTEQDIVKFQLQELNLQEFSAQAAMSSPLFFVTPDDSLWETHQKMQEQNVRRLVVTDQEGSLLGIVTQTNILQAVDIKELYQIIDILQHQVKNLENEKLDLLKRLNSDLQAQVSDRNTKIQTQNQRYQLLADVAFRIRSSLSLDKILQTTVTEVRKLLEVERVIIYQVYSDWSGQVIVESVSQPQWSILGRIIKDDCFAQDWLNYYQNHGSKAIENIYEAGLSNCYIEFLTQFKIQSNLIVPILVDNLLWGLLIAHSCTNVRSWQLDEVEFLEQLSIQVANAIQQATLLEQVQKANAELEAKVAERTQEIQVANERLQQELIHTQQAEAALIEREAIVRSFYDSAPMMIGIVELLDNDILHLSDNYASARFFGTTPELLKNQFSSQMGTPQEYIDFWIHHYQQSQRTGKPVRFEYPHIVDSNIKWLSATVSFIGISHNYRPRFSYILDDVSERKTAEDEKNYLSSLLEASLNEIYVFDADTWKFKYINQGGLKNLGYSLEQMQEMTPLDIKPEMTAEKFQSLVIPLISSEKEIIHFQSIHQRADGSCYLAEVHLQWMEKLDKRVFLAVVLDITQRQQAEQQIKFQAQLLAQMRDAVIAIDICHRVIHWNAAAEQHYGITAEEALGKPITECYEYLWLNPKDETNANEALGYFGFWQGQNIHRKLNGEEIFVESTVSILQDEQGNHIGMLGLIKDISERARLEAERKQAEQELNLKNLALQEAKQQAETANQAKSEFLANMSHEIRTPMNAILGFANLLQSEVKEPHIATYVKAIVSSGKTLLALINDILDLSKIEAGKLELFYEAVDLRVLIRDIVQIFSPHANDKHLILKSNIDKTLPEYIYIDEVRLRQVLFNVVGNALKFTDKGYIKITIRAQSYYTHTEEKLWLEIAVEDTGIGIAREQQKSIFDAFVQSSGKSDRKYGGTGLGLAITKRLINMMGGIITLQSELAKGSIFTFVFPAVSPASQLKDTVVESLADDDLNQFIPSKILVVDDIPSNRNLIKAYFHQTHHQILLAEHGKKAISLAQLHHPDLILLDLRMPVMDGKETAQYLKQHEDTKNIPIVILTASSQSEDRKELEKICQGFLSKPISCSEIVKELKKHLQMVISVDATDQLNSSDFQTQASQLLNLPINLPELLTKLQHQEATKWNSLRKTFKMREMKQFIQFIKTCANEHQCQILLEYADSLQTKLNTFEMEEIPLIIEQFPAVRQAIESLI
jgi:PAS domain S-box-containing protein